MLLLRRYQLDIIFFFFALQIFLWLFLFFLETFGVNPHKYEWIVAGPIIAIYIAYLLKIRGSIKISDRRKITARSLFYWIVLGIILFATYSTPVPAKDYLSINVLFIIFTVLLADSYWDFKKISLKSFNDIREYR
ncbi:MAG: hypothetical protein ABII98_00050 [bacterium]